jgi:hypothetical protein
MDTDSGTIVFFFLFFGFLEITKHLAIGIILFTFGLAFYIAGRFFGRKK